MTTPAPCRSGHTDCTVDCGWCKGTGIDSRDALRGLTGNYTASWWEDDQGRVRDVKVTLADEVAAGLHDEPHP